MTIGKLPTNLTVSPRAYRFDGQARIRTVLDRAGRPLGVDGGGFSVDNRGFDRPPFKISKGALGEIPQYLDLGIFGRTELGSRRNNEDAIAVFQHEGYTFIVVADGMGGHGDGEIASTIAVNAFKKAITKDDLGLADAVQFAHRAVRKRAETRGLLNNMGTTFSVARVRENDVTIIHAGDSPIYLVKKDGRILSAALPHIGLTKEIKRLIAEYKDENDLQAAYDRLLSVTPSLLYPEVNGILALIKQHPTGPYPAELIDLILTLEDKCYEISNTVDVGTFIGVCSGLGMETCATTETTLHGFESGDRLIVASDGLNLRLADLKTILSQKLPVEEAVRQLTAKRGPDGDNLSVLMYEWMELREEVSSLIEITEPDPRIVIAGLRTRVEELEQENFIQQEFYAGLRTLQPRVEQLERDNAAKQARITQLEQENARLLFINTELDGANVILQSANGGIRAENFQLKDHLEVQSRTSAELEDDLRGYRLAEEERVRLAEEASNIDMNEFLSGSIEKVREDMELILNGESEISPENKRKIIDRLNHIADDIPDLEEIADRTIRRVILIKTGGM